MLNEMAPVIEPEERRIEMDRCHICEERATDPDTFFVLNGREYPLCPEHGLKMGDYMVTLLQQHLSEKKGA